VAAQHGVTDPGIADLTGANRVDGRFLVRPTTRDADKVAMLIRLLHPGESAIFVTQIGVCVCHNTREENLLCCVAILQGLSVTAIYGDSVRRC
jgi:hypothetical protein